LFHVCVFSARSATRRRRWSDEVLLSWFLHSEKLKFTAKKMPDEVSGHQSGERSQPSTLATPSLKLAVSQRGKGKGQRESVFHSCFSRSDLFTPTNQRSHSWSSRNATADHEVFWFFTGFRGEGRDRAVLLGGRLIARASVWSASGFTALCLRGTGGCGARRGGSRRRESGAQSTRGPHAGATSDRTLRTEGIRPPGIR